MPPLLHNADRFNAFKKRIDVRQSLWRLSASYVDRIAPHQCSRQHSEADSNTIFYVRNEPTTLRSYQVWRHRLGANPKTDVLIYEESDPTLDISIRLSGSRKFILLNINGERTSESRYLPTDQPTGELNVIEPRRQGVLYEVDHVGDRFFIRTNLDAPDFRLMSAPQATPSWAKRLLKWPASTRRVRT